MPTLPQISGARVAMYPLQRTNKWSVKIQQGTNDHEQRWVDQLPKQQFVLTYTSINATDLGTLKTFWASMHGEDINTFTVDLGTDAVTGVHMLYYNMLFVGDDFEATQKKATRWDVKLTLRQVR
jgi:hypothetical protein